MDTTWYGGIVRLLGGGACGACALEVGAVNSAEVAGVIGGILAVVLPPVYRWARTQLARRRPWLRSHGLDVTDDGLGIEGLPGTGLEGLAFSWGDFVAKYGLIEAQAIVWRVRVVYLDGDEVVGVGLTGYRDRTDEIAISDMTMGRRTSMVSTQSWYVDEIQSGVDGNLIRVQIQRQFSSQRMTFEAEAPGADELIEDAPVPFDRQE